jgi:hypothetical protein
MKLNMTTGRRFLRGSAVLAAMLAALIASPAAAAPGDLLATVNLPGNGSCNVTGTLAATGFGCHYFVINGDGCESTTIGVYAPCAGAVCNATAVATKTVTNTLSGLTYDPGRSTAANVVLWGMHGTSLYRIDLGDPTVSGPATQTYICDATFGGSTLIDGLAYDESDDTLYASPDVDLSVYQLSLGTGGNGPPCTLLNTVSPENAVGVADGLVSGVAIGGGNTLYIGRNGAAEIRLVDKTTGAFISNFSTTAGRVEGLTCDPKTYAPLEAILAKDAYGALYEAFEVEPGTCPLVGGLIADIDIKFCSNPNGFNCKSGGVMPMTVFGSDVLDVQTIDLATVQLCLADDSACIDAESLRNAVYVDRGTADDVGADECAINEETGEEEYFLNPDRIDDLELAWEKMDVVEMLFDDCEDFAKGEASPTLVFKALTYDGVPVSSTPLDDPGIDQVWRQK